MKKFKLIKEYPGSPKLGTTVISIPETLENNKIYEGDKHYRYIGVVIEKFPEYWELLVEKEWEILSFYDKKGPEWFKNKEDEYFTHISGEEYSEEQILEKYPIWSVKRLSDGEVFTVGDKINNSTFGGNGTIKRIRIIENSIHLAFWVKFDKEYKNSDDSECFLKDLSRVKQKLFTTEDGVDIFDKQYYFEIHNYNSDKYKEHIAKYKAIEDGEEDYSNPFSTLCLRFSTKEAAEEYIIMNKPCLSYSDIMNNKIFNNDDLRDLVKQKIEPTELMKNSLYKQKFSWFVLNCVLSD